jgi:hypothetical protein
VRAERAILEQTHAVQESQADYAGKPSETP